MCRLVAPGTPISGADDCHWDVDVRASSHAMNRALVVLSGPGRAQSGNTHLSSHLVAIRVVHNVQEAKKRESVLLHLFLLPSCRFSGYHTAPRDRKSSSIVLIIAFPILVASGKRGAK